MGLDINMLLRFFMGDEGIEDIVIEVGGDVVIVICLGGVVMFGGFIIGEGVVIMVWGGEVCVRYILGVGVGVGGYWFMGCWYIIVVWVCCGCGVIIYVGGGGVGGGGVIIYCGGGGGGGGVGV